jgi:hypothetical protein
MSLPVQLRNPNSAPTHSRGFQQGHPKVGGRRPGSKNKVGTDLRQTILDGIAEVGFAGVDENGKPVAGEGGVKGFIKWLGLHEPRTAAALLARAIPYTIDSAEMPPVASRAEIEAEFKDLGLPMELIECLQKAPAPLDDDEDPDPWGLTLDAEPDAAK